MRIDVDLALVPGAARRRGRWIVLGATALVGALSALHLAWAVSARRDPGDVLGQAGLVEREAAVVERRIAELEATLEPERVADLVDEVDAVNGIILQRAATPSGLLTLLEGVLPPGVTLERLTMSATPTGLQGEITLTAPDPGAALEATRRLAASPSAADVRPVREDTAAGRHRVVLSLRYLPDAPPPEGPP